MSRLALASKRLFCGDALSSHKVVLIEDGKVKALCDYVPSGWEVINAPGDLVTPGLVDAHTHAGILSEGSGWAGSDVNEMTGPVTAGLRAVDAVDYTDSAFAKALQAGVTTVLIVPGSSNVIGGTGFTMKTHGTGYSDMILEEPAVLKSAIARFYGKQGKFPATRMGVFSILRSAFWAASLEDAKQVPGLGELGPTAREHLRMVLAKKIPLRVHLMNVTEILALLALARECDISVVLDHASDADLVVDEIRDAGVPVVYGPLFVPRDGPGRRRRSAVVAARLIRAGVKTAIMTDHPIVPLKYLRLEAGLLIREGIGWQEAMKSITSNPADILGLGGRVGRLVPGSDADLVCWANEPWQPNGRALMVLVNGRVVHQI